MKKIKKDGSFCVVRNQYGEILLAKHNYGQKKWSLPGGGIEIGEDSKLAGEREVIEETGLIVEATLLSCKFFWKKIPYYSVELYESNIIGGNLQPQEDEISELGFFSLDSLPDVYQNQVKMLDIWKNHLTHQTFNYLFE